MLRRQPPYSRAAQAPTRRACRCRCCPRPPSARFPRPARCGKARAAAKKGDWSLDQYEEFCREEIQRTVRFQEEIGLDVLVHGECERNDMVEYFGEQLDGFAFTDNGWVQSYGSRCVKPPIIFGDVSPPRPMTVALERSTPSRSPAADEGHAHRADHMLQWSFVRDDQPRRDTAFQIALAIRDEVADLEAAGIGVIQIDEPALREGLPLRRDQWAEYLEWAVEAFRLAVVRRAPTRRRSTRTCATRSSTTSSSRSPPWTPT